MEKKHKNELDLGNPLRSMVGQPYYGEKPSNEKILEELLDGFAKFSGTCWNPVSLNGGTELTYNQCPGACGHVWRINIQDNDVANWLVNEINQRRFNK